MPKKITEKQKKELTDSFFRGVTLEELSERFGFSKVTISRYLKESISDQDYKKLTKKNSKKRKASQVKDEHCISKYESLELASNQIIKEESFFEDEAFKEIVPLNSEIIESNQKDFASVPICEAMFPDTAYMIVDKKIELETKTLRDYPEWQFLSQNELERKTIEIHFDLKLAKRMCEKDQKVIKVPNTNVFKIVAPILLSRGISRIVSSDNLIAL